MYWNPSENNCVTSEWMQVLFCGNKTNKFVWLIDRIDVRHCQTLSVNHCLITKSHQLTETTFCRFIPQLIQRLVIWLSLKVFCFQLFESKMSANVESSQNSEIRELLRKELLDLNAQRTKIENEIKEWQSILRSVTKISFHWIRCYFNDFNVIMNWQQNVGMDDSLVDSTGFPRNDIDVHQIRIARNKIICNIE